MSTAALMKARLILNIEIGQYKKKYAQNRYTHIYPMPHDCIDQF